MKWIYGIVLALIPASAWATQASILCRATDTGQIIDVVDKGDSNGVLVQVDGGRFLDGLSKFDSPILKVYVPLDTGALALVYDVQKHQGAYAIRAGNINETHDMTCQFRN